MEIAELIFTVVGVFATIGFGIWGGNKIIHRFRSRITSTYSPKVKGDSNVVTINAFPPEAAQLLQQLLQASPSSAPTLIPASPSKAVAEFKIAISSKSETLTGLLLKAAEAAKALGRDEDLRWIEKELTGYYAADAKLFPDYRRLEFEIRILAPNDWGIDQLRTLPYPVQWGPNITEVERFQEAIEKNPAQEFTGEAPVQPWMKEGPMGEIFSNHETFPLVFGASQVKTVVNGVRRRLHKFFLDLPATG